jgi:hypothetical protein
MSISMYHWLSLCSTSFLFAAENKALRTSLALKESATTMIPRPEKGVAGNGFNLQEAMGLADDAEKYNLLRVSPTTLCTCSSLAHDCSVLSGICQLKQGSIVQYCGTANPKNLSARLLESYVSLPFTFYRSYLKYILLRHDSNIAISTSSHMVGPSKNS